MPSSPSPAASAASLDTGPPSLEQLVAHFVSSKRSLSSIHDVYRANDIVTAARRLLEDDAVLTAKVAFVRQGINDQLRNLGAIRQGIEQIVVEGRVEFENLLATLDDFSHHLLTTLDMLRDTPIHGSLQPPGAEQRYLFDFIDTSSVDELNASLRACIDRTNDASSALTDTLEHFGTSIRNITQSLVSTNAPTDPSPTPSSFLVLENHATEAAALLQSLVRHYDLCVTAIKHTEGGNEAATRATSDDPLPTELNHPHLDNAALPPMSAAERADMLAVLVNDAVEVEDVVAEIHERVSDMEAVLGEMSAHVATVQGTYAGVMHTFRLLKGAGNDIPTHMSACRVFLARWADERSKIEQGVLALEGLKEFYDGFLDAYDGLLVEIGRRRDVRVKMEAIAREAVRKINRLYEDDVTARNSFHATQGDHLPSDIWPGLVDPPPRYSIAMSTADRRDGHGHSHGHGHGHGGENDAGEEGAVGLRDISIPHLPDEVIAAARRRMEARR
ncbi:uncharacterized protein K452DRAFT_232874 [Aplosporella prunicola CBS 121167]|uniref:Autophagy-related protein 17 n=1 Tax=Aplosporella prunicola CBS 121167 TaxID=1176127 RepID=A0A6A6B3X1_9PEZI|nr:uncharacterized protein K452DRAFT_232874 [Aplosporella prunicola CBS 121167]KAF2138919.1 hypothetical protein K452DRAFT_232874 [Aplosporella prunicola CBS 121167]